MKTANTDHAADPVVIEAWDAIGRFAGLDNTGPLSIEIHVADGRYEVDHFHVVKTKNDLRTHIGDYTLLSNDPKKELSAYADGDYALVIFLHKTGTGAQPTPATTIPQSTNLQQKDSGKPFFIALHYDDKKKYRRSSQSIVSNITLEKMYIDARVGE